MMISRFFGLGTLQIAVMKALWKRSPLSVFEVVEELSGEKIPAYTTALTALRNLETRGLAGHNEVEGRRSYAYFPILTLEEAREMAVREALADLFEGNAGMLLHHLIQTQTLSEDEIKEAQEALEIKRSSSTSSSDV